MSHADVGLLQILGRNWWVIALRGILAISFGILAFMWPGITLFVLVILFAAYAFVDGVGALVGALRAAEDRQRAWPFVIEGIVGIAAGIVAFVWPGITAVALLYVIAAWAIVTGLFELYAAIKLRRQIEGEWWLALGGVASIIFGGLLVLLPGPGALALVWLIAFYAIVFGVLLLALALRVRRWQAEERPGAEPETAL